MNRETIIQMAREAGLAEDFARAIVRAAAELGKAMLAAKESQ